MIEAESLKPLRRMFSMRRILLIASVAVLSSMVTHAATKTLRDYKTVYEKEVAKIESACQERLNRELTRYGKKLPLIEVALKKAGRVDGVVAIKEEIARFEDEETIPDAPPPGLPDLAKQAQVDFGKTADGIRSEREKLTADLIRRYLRPLNALKRNLLVADKLDEARGVDTEIKRIEFVLADIESSLPKTEKPDRATPATAKSKHIGKLPAALTEGLVLYYDFYSDEGAKVTDKSGKLNQGKVHGAKWTKEGVGARRTARGIVGGAYEFDGRSSRLECPSGRFLNGASAVTISLWVKSSKSTGSSQGLLSKIYGRRPYWSMYLFKGGSQLKWEFADQGTQAVILTDDNASLHGKWVHIVVCQKKRQASVYLNGQLVKTDELELAFSASQNPSNALLLGCLERGGTSSPSFPFLGLMDEVMIWDRAVSDAEIKQVYKLTGGK
jgi:hypothetical protein